jgi:tRNA(Ile)-lysidine synthase
MSLKNLSVTKKIPKLLISKLKNKKINTIYKRFENSLNIKENFIVAVSGGPDSLALAFLAKIYSIKKKLVSRFLIVDHKLRPESTKEARAVKKILGKQFINAKILTWRGNKPIKNIQSLARKKRYELLFADSDKLKIDNILLGHHRNDLIENFFIRMLRGSGLKGLVSLDKKVKLGKKNLLRPLMDYKKDDLIFVAKHVFNFYVEDPTNKDENFKRIKIRKLIEDLKENGLDEIKLLNTIKNLKYSNNVVEFYVKENFKKNGLFLKRKNKLIINKIFFEQPYEIIFRTFSEAIKLVGKKYYSVRGKKLDKIIRQIIKDQFFKVTLGGCIIEKVNQTVIISKEH